MKSQAMGKFLGLSVVVILLLLGLSQITDLVQERQAQRRNAVQSIAQSLAGTQTLLGPLMHMACVEEWDAVQLLPEGRREFTLIALPATLTVGANSQLSPRARGMHATQVFQQRTTLTAHWNDLSTLKASHEHKGSRLQCGQPLLMLSVSDARGIRQLDVKLNDSPLQVRSGTFMRAYPRGIHAVLPAGLNLDTPMTAEVQLELVGIEHFGVVPLGGASAVRLQSNWAHPSFDGQFLPLEHKIDAAGFDASWRVSSLASSAQRNVEQGMHLCQQASDETASAPEGASADRNCVETLGVTYIDPSNTYALSNRATKYGLLFIVLTFVAVGLFELMRSLRVHPVQYFLVGAALSIFFLLLVSLSEHMPFAAAYAWASAGCVLLLTYYATHILQSWTRGLPFGFGISCLYGLLYVLLRLEQTALVVGALALFLVLALVMLLTRKVDWYARLKAETVLSPAVEA